MKAIKINVKKAPENYDLAASKFFGSPTIPSDWLEDFYDEDIFFLQIRLSDIKDLDKDNKLPHEGYLYIFLDTSEGDYYLKPIVKYYNGEPNMVLDEFNSFVDEYKDFVDAYLMEFELVDEDEICTKLFGNPSDWNYEEEMPKLLLQYDPLDNEMGFLDHLDGFIYFCFNEETNNLEDVYLLEEYS